ncbi:DUF3800 domain-containing protein [Candidatus Saccharibacteria bacterium]|nr:DUF3800 domain-containing protein [Candidatus Saccharibacteria bacterium]
MTKIQPTVYMDESGDLGFDFTKQKTSRYFVVSFVFTAHPRQLDKMVNKIFHGFTKKEVKNHHGVLHCYKEHPKNRVRLLNSLAKSNSSVLTLKLDKKRVYTRLHDEKHVLYNYVVNILLDRMIGKKLIPLDGEIRFVASRRETSKFLNENFVNYLNSQTASNHKLKIQTEIIKPSQEKGLQVIDFVAWSYFRKYEHTDSSYADIIQDITVEEGRLFG